MTQVIPKSSNAHGACSLDEPQPKFLPAIKILELLKEQVLEKIYFLK